MSYLFEIGRETGNVLRIGQLTISVEYNGDGPYWRTLPDGELDPIYPYYSIRDIVDLSDRDIDRIGELIKEHLKKRRRKANSEFEEVFSELDPKVENDTKEVQ